MTWLFAYFDVSWVVHGGAAVASAMLGQGCHGGKEGQGHMQASLNQSISQQDGIARAVGRAGEAGIFRAVRSSADLGNRPSLDLGTTIGHQTVARTPPEKLPRTPLERSYATECSDPGADCADLGGAEACSSGRGGGAKG